MKSRKIYPRTLVVSLLTLLISFVLLGFSRLQTFSSWINLSRIDTKNLEISLDNNPESWKNYRDSTISLKMPIYLSSFNDISATELTTKDDRVSSYFRSSGGNSEEGRSYWITLQQPQFNTAQIDVKEWIINQELNINHDSKEVVNIIDSELGGKPAYQIQFYLDNSGTPGFEKVYFQTREGIRSIGFRAWDNEKQRQLDYKIYRQILSTLRFTNQYE